MKSVRIACYSAFWGDSITAAHQLIHASPPLDYVVADYLAEVTMGLLARRQLAGSSAYIGEFVDYVWKPLGKRAIDNKTVIITNAGGLDPVGCKEAIEQASKEMGLEGVKVAAVYGDDLLSDYEAIRDSLVNFTHTGESDVSMDGTCPPKDKKVLSFNAYTGAVGIAQAVAAGAQVIVCGRCVDSALVVGPLMHEFKWNPAQDYNLMASASLAGHIIECGCQATGGNFTDWKESCGSPHGGWANMGYPIVEFFGDGTFHVTKVKGTGGLVTRATVGEQMVYEVLDPGMYILPDVIVDMRQVELHQIQENVVRVHGCKGRLPTGYLKVSGVYVDGYKMSAKLMIGGVEAREKARAVADAILKRSQGMMVRMGLKGFRETRVEVLGSEETYGPHSKARDVREVVLRITVTHDDKQAMRIFGMELAPSATCMAPGITGSGGGRPRPQPQLVHFSVLVPKQFVTTHVLVGKDPVQLVRYDTVPTSKDTSPPPILAVDNLPHDVDAPTIIVPLIRLAWGRSGDKGDASNIGIIARDPRYFYHIKQQVTAKSVKAYMKHLCKGNVYRYELPGIHAINFVLTQSLGGGGLSSLNIDRQGKTYAQILLTMPISVPSTWFSKL